MSEAGRLSEQAITTAAASVRGPSSWEYSVRKHCEVLTIPLDLRETGWMLLKLKKFVNAVCVYSNGRNLLQKSCQTSRRSLRTSAMAKDAQELACAHKEV